MPAYAKDVVARATTTFKSLRDHTFCSLFFFFQEEKTKNIELGH